MNSCRTIQALLRSSLRPSSSSPSLFLRKLSFIHLSTKSKSSQNLLSPSPHRSVHFHFKPNSVFSSSVTLRLFNTSSSRSIDNEEKEEDPFRYETDEGGETTDGWEEEDEAEPEIGDGGDGGGIVLQDVPWGEQALSLAREVLLQFGDDMKLYAFKTSPRGYIYVRLDKLSNKYGCPSLEELESYNQEYKKRLDEAGSKGEIPDDLALEISSPSAERLLKVPDDLDRFKDMPMRVHYVDDVESKCTDKDGVFMLESVETDSDTCVWKLANTKENRDPLSKGRPLNRKQKDWRLKVPFAMHTRVSLYLEC